MLAKKYARQCAAPHVAEHFPHSPTLYSTFRVGVPVVGAGVGSADFVGTGVVGAGVGTGVVGVGVVGDGVGAGVGVAVHSPFPKVTFSKELLLLLHVLYPFKSNNKLYKSCLILSPEA